MPRKIGTRFTAMSEHTISKLKAVPVRVVERHPMWSSWLSSSVSAWSLPTPRAAPPFGAAPTHPSPTLWMPRVKAGGNLPTGFKQIAMVRDDSKSWTLIKNGRYGQSLRFLEGIPYPSSHPWTGPAWANSLFEDNAEFGFGMRKAVQCHDCHVGLMKSFKNRLLVFGKPSSRSYEGRPLFSNNS